MLPGAGMLSMPAPKLNTKKGQESIKGKKKKKRKGKEKVEKRKGHNEVRETLSSSSGPRFASLSLWQSLSYHYLPCAMQVCRYI